MQKPKKDGFYATKNKSVLKKEKSTYVTEKTVQIGDEILHYEIVNDEYIKITGVSNAPGKTLIKNDGTQGLKADEVLEIFIPEIIDGYPVFAVDKLDIRCFYHSQLWIRINLPANTTFNGFDRVNGFAGWKYPDYEDIYYKRRQKLLHSAIYQGCVFTAKPMDDKNCEITDIACAKKESGISIIIPDQIKGLSPFSIAAKTGNDLPQNVTCIEFPDCLKQVKDNCFMNMGELEEVHLGGVQVVGENSFSYSEIEKYSAKNLPTLHVFHSGVLTYPKSAFQRVTEVWKYEEYLDWGDMYTDSDYVTHEVIFVDETR